MSVSQTAAQRTVVRSSAPATNALPTRQQFSRRIGPSVYRGRSAGQLVGTGKATKARPTTNTARRGTAGSAGTIANPDVRQTHGGPIGHLRCIGGVCSRIPDQQTEVDISDVPEDVEGLARCREGEVHGISAWWIFAIVIAIILIIVIAGAIIANKKNREQSGVTEPNFFDRYILVWSDKFNGKRLNVRNWTARTMLGTKDIDAPDCRLHPKNDHRDRYSNHRSGGYSSDGYFSDEYSSDDHSSDDEDESRDYHRGRGRHQGKTLLRRGQRRRRRERYEYRQRRNYLRRRRASAHSRRPTDDYDPGYKHRTKERSFACRTKDNKQIYTKQKRNVRVSDHQLIIEAHRQPAAIKQADGRRKKFSFTSSQLISRVAVDNGFINLKVTLPNIPGAHPVIRLLPYTNACMNEAESVYGHYPYCGQIDLVRRGRRSDEDHFQLCQTPWFVSRDDYHPSSYQGEPFVASDLACQKLESIDRRTRTHILGLEWTSQALSWYLDARIDDRGRLRGGWLLHKVKFDDIDAIDQWGCRLLKSKPFDQLFNLVLELAIDEDLPPEIDSVRMTVDWVRIYQRPQRQIITDSDAEAEVLGGNVVS